MYNECRHIMPSGRRCKSPALGGKFYCFHHFGMAHHVRDGLDNRKEPLILPSLEDTAGIQIAVMQVTNALGSGRLTSKQAGLYLYAFQIASTLAARAERQSPVKDPVRSLTCDDWGDYIAEESSVCEPPHDCLNCKNRNRCDKFEDYEEEVEELEQQLAEQQAEEEEDNEDDESEVQSKCNEDEESEEDKEQDGDDENQSVLKALHARANSIQSSLVSGHEFIRTENATIKMRALARAHAPSWRTARTAPQTRISATIVTYPRKTSIPIKAAQNPTFSAQPPLTQTLYTFRNKSNKTDGGVSWRSQ